VVSGMIMKLGLLCSFTHIYLKHSTTNTTHHSSSPLTYDVDQ
jgi:hypothetical protein